MKEMSKDRQKELTSELEVANDWEGQCRHCGKVLKGTLKELREHVCDQSSRDPAAHPER